MLVRRPEKLGPLADQKSAVLSRTKFLPGLLGEVVAALVGWETVLVVGLPALGVVYTLEDLLGSERLEAQLVPSRHRAPDFPASVALSGACHVLLSPFHDQLDSFSHYHVVAFR